MPVFALLGSDHGGSVSIDPILLIERQKIRSVPNPCTETPALRNFASQYLNPAHAYPVVFGGARRGTAFVTKLEGSDWGVRLDSDVRVQGFTMALAVGSI